MHSSTAYFQLQQLRFSWSADTPLSTRNSPEWIHRRDSSGQSWSICLTKDCIESAAFLLKRIDFSVDPCDNFYEFACGKFLRSYTVPDDHMNRNILQEIQDEIYVEMKGYLEQSDYLHSKKKIHSNQSADSINDIKESDYMSNQQAPFTPKRAGSQAIRKARLFYRSCMNESTVNDEPAAVRVLMNLLTDDGNLRWLLLDRLNQSRNRKKSENFEPNLEHRMFVVFLHQIQVRRRDLERQHKYVVSIFYQALKILHSFTPV